MKQRTKALALLCLTHWIWHNGTQWTNSLLPFLQWDSKPPMTMIWASYFHSFGSFCNAIGAFLLGSIIDSYGLKASFMATVVLTSCYYIGLSWCQSLPLFFTIQLFRVGYHFDALAEMYLATVTTEQERTQAVMTLGMPLAFAMVSGPILATRIAIFMDLRTSQFLNGAILIALLTVMVLKVLPDTHSIPKLSVARLRPQNYWPLFQQNRGLREALLLKFLITMPHIAYELISRQFLMRAYVRQPGDATTILVAMGSTVLVTQLIILPLLQPRVTPKRLLQLSIGLLLACYALVPSIRGYNQLVALTALQAAAYSLSYAETSTQITMSVGKAELGKVTGMSAMMQWLAHFVSPLMTGHMVTMLHYSYTFYISAALTALTFVLVTFYLRNVNNRVRTVLPVLSMGG